MGLAQTENMTNIRRMNRQSLQSRRKELKERARKEVNEKEMYNKILFKQDRLRSALHNIFPMYVCVHAEQGFATFITCNMRCFAGSVSSSSCYWSI